MQFNSLQFFLFFFITVGIYFTLPHRFRWILLLAASYYFYMCWRAEYIVLILVSTFVDYVVGLKMGATQNKAKRRKYLILSLCANLGLLFAFKYFNFFNDSARLVFDHFNIFYNVPSFKALLPVGISFYTFQTLSYTIDVYRGVKKPERHLGKFAVYVAFFPQLVAGPIERSTHLLPQFSEKHYFNYKESIEGAKLILWGLFKKMVIADRLAVVVDQVYSSPTEFTGLAIIFATYCFAFQIYCDFSGYSDIAIGASRILGFRLMTNFKRPYLAKNIPEFWSRWHISLTTWFKDYLYIPLGGNRVAKWRWYFNVFAVFIISGIWHGANWTFIVWGFIHGLFYIIFLWTTAIREKIKSVLKESFLLSVYKVFSMFVTFNIVALGWIYFRAQNLSDAWYMTKNVFNFSGAQQWADMMMPHHYYIYTFCFSVVILKMILEREHPKYFERLGFKFSFPTQIFYALVINFLIFFGVQSNEGFIYFQF